MARVTTMGELAPQIRRQLGLPSRTTGVVVTVVEPGSPAAEAGLRRGDVIQQVNGREVASASDFERAIRVLFTHTGNRRGHAREIAFSRL